MTAAVTVARLKFHRSAVDLVRENVRRGITGGRLSEGHGRFWRSVFHHVSVAPPFDLFDFERRSQRDLDRAGRSPMSCSRTR